MGPRYQPTPGSGRRIDRQDPVARLQPGWRHPGLRIRGSPPLHGRRRERQGADRHNELSPRGTDPLRRLQPRRDPNRNRQLRHLVPNLRMPDLLPLRGNMEQRGHVGISPLTPRARCWRPLATTTPPASGMW